MNKINQRAVIQYLQQKSLAPKGIHTDMIATLAKTVPSNAIIRRWRTDFNMTSKALKMALSKKAFTVSTLQIVNKVHDIAIADRQVIERHTVSIVSISGKKDCILL
jgi:hypothetical protein